MLTHIHIRDFAIIEELELELDAGLTVLTGETGAGKSILVDAIGLVLGDRADSGVVRTGAERAEISLSLDLENHDEANQWLVDNDLDAGSECHLRRVIGSDGRSRAYVNATPCTLATLRTLGELLVDIHGQHEHQSLLRRDMQRALLDGYAGNQAELEAMQQAYRQWRKLKDRLDSLTAEGDARQARLDVLRYQVKELEALELGADEYDGLEDEHRRLAHAGRLLESCEMAYEGLYGAEEGAVDSQLSHFMQQVESARELDPRLAEPVELLNSAQVQLREAAEALRRYADHLDLDPARLNQVEERLGLIHDLARKHRTDPQALPELFENLSSELAALEDEDCDVESLAKALNEAGQQCSTAAETLGARRQDAGQRLSEGVSAAMQTLGMEGGRFEVQLDVQPEPFSPNGQERVEFRVSANPGQPLRPLAKVASGGELSRISLAIQMLAAGSVRIPTMIFDEVDSGVGGAVAEVVGRELRRLGATRQVLCVTHLPQVAAQAHHHCKVEKRRAKDATHTEITPLDEQARVQELARMLGGVELTENTRAHAQEMLERAQNTA
ncbi:MAG: DNA repair protein RecN [Gammaproteobacteria bacterium]